MKVTFLEKQKVCLNFVYLVFCFTFVETKNVAAMKQTHTYSNYSNASFFSPVRQAVEWASRNWFNAILLYLAGHLLFQRDLSLQINMDGVGANKSAAAPYSSPTSLENASQTQQATFVPAINISQLVQKKIPAPTTTTVTSTPTKGKEPTFSVSNLTPALSPDYAKRKGIDPGLFAEKEQVLQDYVQKYAPAAIRAMQNYGIPASITLAQGLLESNAGGSKLARESNNHFGIKCRRKCRGCTCRNYTDDDVFDMFRVFESVWESYEEHSVLLSSPRYKHLQKFGTDYKSWAYGLKRAGYATDKTYAQKLIRIIRNMNLDQYDL